MIRGKIKERKSGNNIYQIMKMAVGTGWNYANVD